MTLLNNRSVYGLPSDETRICPRSFYLVSFYQRGKVKRNLIPYLVLKYNSTPPPT